MNTRYLFSFSTFLILSLLLGNSIAAPNMDKVQEKYLAPAIKIPLLNKANPYRIKLGKTLFFDPRLSGSNWISCGTCHNPTLGWSDGLPKANGEGQRVLRRATPTILNAAYSFLQMWDGRFNSLEEQALGPIESASEMNQDLDKLVIELSALEQYVELFKDAYPGRGITQDTISLALSNFERTILAKNAPFDRWIKGDNHAISNAAKRGFDLFEGKGHCSTCHSGFNFSDNGFHNIGLDDDDIGRYSVKKVDILQGAFKTPTLRNIEITAPYMHDGSYSTLEDVIGHYVKGGIRKNNLSPNFKKAELNKAEVQDLVAFLRSLTSEPQDIEYPELPTH